MARALPDPLERRNLLWAEQKRPVDPVALAERYLESGRMSDALDFVERVPDRERKDALRAHVRDAALREGNFFLLNRLESTSPLGDDRWREALERARETGKLRYALKIARKLGDAAEIEALERDLGIVRPAEPLPPVAADAAAALTGEATPITEASEAGKSPPPAPEKDAAPPA